MSDVCRVNELLYQKCYNALIDRSSDVQFVFETGTDVVRVPATKSILSALSPVFNAMFNGELKEKGDVKIVDATVDAFQEFLHLLNQSFMCYGNRVKLTMKNIAEVLKLVDKYDVADCMPLCTNFLMKNTQIGDILWTLNLAIHYNLDDLKAFCEHKIQHNYKIVFDMFNFENGQLWLEPDSRLSEMDMENIFPYLFAISRNIFSNLAVKLDSSYLPVNLTSKGFSHVTVTNNEAIQFSINQPMLLAKIICSDIFICDITGNRTYTTHPFIMYIDVQSTVNSADTKRVFAQNIVIRSVANQKNYIDMQPPIWIEPNYIYTISFKTDSVPKGLCTQRANIPETPIELAPGIDISFGPKYYKYFHTLISQLYFKYAQD